MSKLKFLIAKELIINLNIFKNNNNKMIKIVCLFMMALSFKFDVVHYHYHMSGSSSLQPAKHFSGNKHDWDWL